LTFIRDQRVITASQCAKLRELELKVTKTDAEKAELDTLKATVIAAAKELDALNQKQDLTEPERLRLIELNTLMQDSAAILMQYQDDFEAEFNKISSDAQNAAIDKAAATAVIVAKAKGFTLVFSSSAVVYAANDITADVVKEANK
jgi:Skp family chaperone for outer membrane proteins